MHEKKEKKIMCAWPTFQNGVTCLLSLFILISACIARSSPSLFPASQIFHTHFKVMLLPFLEQISHPLETIKEPKRGVQLKSDKFCKWKISISQAEQKQLCMQGIVYPEPWIPPQYLENYVLYGLARWYWMPDHLALSRSHCSSCFLIVLGDHGSS